MSENIGSDTGVSILWEAFRLALQDLARMIPSVLLAVLIIAVYLVIGIMLNSVLRRFLRILRLDELAAPIARQLRIRPSSLIIALIDIGLVVLAGYTIILVVAPGYLELANQVVYYIAKVASVVALIVVAFVIINTIVGYIRLETKLRGFMFLILLFVTLILIIDIAALSEEVKTALTWGISIGLALLIAVFSVWYFFHEVLEKKISI